MLNFLKNCRKVGLVKPIFPLSLFLIVLTLLGFWRYGISPELLFFLLLLPFLGVIFLLDLKIQKIPDFATLGIAALGILQLLITKNYEFSLSPLIAVPIIWILAQVIGHVKKTKPLGEGDILLIGACSCWLAPLHLPYFAIAVGCFGVGFAMLWRQKFEKSVFPFAPAVLLGMVFIRMIFGDTA